MKILALTVEQRRAAAADADPADRTGVFTSAIIAVCGGAFPICSKEVDKRVGFP